MTQLESKTPPASIPGQSPAPRTPLASRALPDLIAVLVLVCAGFLFATRFEWYETFSRWIGRFEPYQADELPFALLLLAAGLAWYAFRRWSEARAALHQREQAEARSLDLSERNRELARQLISVQESERRALARELHDELGQSCNAIRVEAAFIQRCESGDRQRISDAADRVAATAEALYQTVRGMLRQLRPANLDELGLTAAIQALGEIWEERSGVACVFHCSGDLDALGDEYAITIYRVVQEALSNVMRHAQASNVRINLAREAGSITLIVADDGVGTAGATRSHGLGLLGASERAAALGGTLAFNSEVGAGSTLVMRLPLGDNPRP